MLELGNSVNATHRLATSALPGAPRTETRPVPSGRTRSAAAALLRRAADRLAPEHPQLVAQ